jgi:hypothetical protein
VSTADINVLDKIFLRTNGSIQTSGDISIGSGNLATFVVTSSGNVTAAALDCTSFSCSGQVAASTLNTSGKIYVQQVESSNTSSTNLEMSAGGQSQRCTISSQQSHIQLYSLSNKNIYHWANFQNVSDDRVKWEESPITTKSGLNVTNMLRPFTYWKGNKIDVVPTENERRWEAGFIAQEVQQIPELEHAVSQVEETDGKYFDGMYTLNYSQIQPYHIAATQELHKLINALTSRVAQLETQIKNK